MEPLRRKCDKCKSQVLRVKSRCFLDQLVIGMCPTNPDITTGRKKTKTLLATVLLQFFAFTIFISLFIFQSCPEPSSCWSQCTISPPPINLSHPFLLSSPSHLPFAPCSGCCKGFTLLIFPKQTRWWLKAARRDAEHELRRPRGPAGEVITPPAPQEVTHPGLKWEPLSEYSPKF